MSSRVFRRVGVAVAIAFMAVRSMYETLFESTVGSNGVCIPRTLRSHALFQTNVRVMPHRHRHSDTNLGAILSAVTAAHTLASQARLGSRLPPGPQFHAICIKVQFHQNQSRRNQVA